MRNKSSGIMLITTILICAILFMLVLSILSLKENMRYNASTLEYSDRAFVAAKSGTQEALKMLDIYFKDPKNTIFSLKDKNLLVDWTSIASNPDLQYCYKIDNGVIYAGGRYTRLSGNKRTPLAVKYLKMNYIVEVMGVTAAKEVATSEKKAIVRSVFSYQTQLPFDPWMGVATGDSAKIGLTPYKGVASAFPGGITDYFALLKDEENAKDFARRLHFEGKDWEGRKFADFPAFGFDLLADLDLSASDLKNMSGGVPGLSLADLQPLRNDPDNYSVTLPPLSSDRQTRFGDAPDKHTVTVITGKNLWAVQRGTALYVPNDLLLKDAFLLVTGSLAVGGTIRGNGLIVALDNIVFSPANRAYPDIEGFKEPFDAKEKLIVYAGGNINVRGRAESEQGFKFGKIDFNTLPRIATQGVSDYSRLIEYYETGKFKTNEEAAQIINK